MENEIEQETLDNYINGNTGNLERYELIQLIRYFQKKAEEAEKELSRPNTMSD